MEGCAVTMDILDDLSLKKIRLIFRPLFFLLRLVRKSSRAETGWFPYGSDPVVGLSHS